MIEDGAVAPALDGASIAGVIPALLGARDASWLPAAARGAAQVVLLVLDGLGWHAIREHAGIMPTLAAMDGGPITTVVPATTATALTSITTGLAPAQHGVLGYRMLVGRDVLNVLRWSVADGNRAPDPFDVQRHTAFLGREVPVITRAEFRRTGFTEAHLRGGRFIGWQTTSMLIDETVRCVEAGERLVYAYYPGVDTVAHHSGLRATLYRRELAYTDRLVDELRAALPADAVLLVTSDHGQVHVEDDSWVELPEVEARTFAMAGDARFRYCYARRGNARELLDVTRDAVGDRGWVWSRAELLDSGLLGAGATGSVPGRIGDVVIAARDAYAFVDPALPRETQLKSAHGSLTPDEMLVPLLAANGGEALPGAGGCGGVSGSGHSPPPSSLSGPTFICCGVRGPSGVSSVSPVYIFSSVGSAGSRSSIFGRGTRTPPLRCAHDRARTGRGDRARVARRVERA